MIAKKYRLPEREWRKVFKQKKPFFLYPFSAKVIKNQLGYARIGIVLSAKTTRGSVNRNFFRRRFYDSACDFLSFPYDVVVIPKRGTTFSHKNPDDIQSFDACIQKLFSTITK